MDPAASPDVQLAPPSQALPLSPRLRTLVRTLQERRARTAADRELARRLHAAVGAAKLEAGGLSFYVHDGAIAVYGQVRSDALREAVLALAAEQPGARLVVDHLRLAEA